MTNPTTAMNPTVRKDDERFLELLDRWMQGNFTRNDEQELYALTDADEFRREAWEGLMALPEADHARRLGLLREKLLGHKPHGRVFIFPQWMAAAAALALLIVAVWWFAPWRPQPDQPIASVTPDKATETPQPAAPAPANEEKNTGLAQNTPASEAEYLPPAVNRAAGKQAPALPDIVQDDLAMTTETRATSEEQISPAELSSKPVPAASAPAGAPASPPVATSADKAKKANRQEADTFNTDTRPDMSAVRKLDTANEQPEPVKGWDEFSEYLRQNARLTAEARNNNVSGTVRLQFAVDNNGAPYNFQIMKSLGYGCDQEAIRLINEWEWTPGRRPLTVDIRFVR